MDRSIYSAVSGMQASMIRQRAIASNLANAQTAGFKAELFDSRAITVKGDPVEVRAMNRTEVRGANMTDGDIIATGGPLDIAMQGDTVLAVQALDGSEAYTRRGDLSITSAGVLQTGDGLPVIGDGGPVTVPVGGDVRIGPDGAILVIDPAAPDAPPERIGRLKLASFAGTDIAKGLDGQFRVRGGGILPEDLEAKIIPGAIEQSNVSTSQVMVDMIEAQRLFEIRTNIVSTNRDLDESGARLMRLD
ncbi:flagellar basal body rod protein FlgF [Croceicoccus gelatinilyticus]|uniref:flagellar basal body rod protein FlgF n=1 Tax=Croceicoccus gelatinilyticus TaxID=2835536 RepID=UPI001BCEB23A|nr:flagellar basal body rod protein FlgF [Croceicoccus gelatinilyticus]MBS7671316.1 flagellar basal body rod protein FlgF [Croceicoccus gelatinilyticus]